MGEVNVDDVKLQDKHMAWARKRVFRGAQDMRTYITAGTGPVSCDAGGTVLHEIGTSGMAAFKMTATADLAQDFIIIPPDFDVSQASYWRCYFTSDTTKTTKTWTPTMKYKKIGAGTAIAAAATALDTVIAQDTSPGANKLAITPWGTLNANKLTRGGFVAISFKASGTLATNGLWFLGYEFEYTPRKFSGAKATAAAPRMVS